MLRVDFKLMKTMFFDRAKVKKKVDARTRKVLSKFGAFVRQTSRRSIRKRKGTSKPGRPPFSHTGTLKKFLFFGYDADKRSVVIGPVIAPGKTGKAPATLEHGGKLAVSSQLPSGRFTTVGGEIQPRPFMQPAFEKEVGQVPKLWQDSIR